jgi:hypothetical protein
VQNGLGDIVQSFFFSLKQPVGGWIGPSEKNNLAAANPDKVAAMQKRLDELAKEAGKPLFLVDQFKVVIKNMNGEPLMPGDDGFGDHDNAPPKIGSAH